MDRWVVVSRPKRKRWCSACALEVEMISIDEAALRAQVNSRTIVQWAESGAVHWSETAKGLLLICPNSPNLSV
jgi:hypothetical protein